MPLPLIPIGIGILASGAAYAKFRRDKPVSPQLAAERAVIYDTAINTLKDPDKLRKLALAFKDAGLEAESTMLIKRAMLAEAPPEVKAQRKEIFRRAMESKNVAGIRAVADANEEIGATGAANALRQYAKGLEDAEVLEQVAIQEQANVQPEG